MDAQTWDERYGASDLVWSAGPNQWVEELTQGLTPGRALDVAAGEGRNGIWLATRGWTVLATDYSRVAIERAQRLASDQLGADDGRFRAVVADATEPPPGGSGDFDLVIFSYLQLTADELRRAWAAGVDATAPGGVLLVIGHAARNLTEGHGGPQDASLLYDPEDVVAGVSGLPVTVESAELRVRHVQTDDGEREALDTVAVLRRT
jgi:SAM-dependent methyltransferase